MGDTNRVSMIFVEETTLGTTPSISGGNLRTGRLTGEGLNFNIANIKSQELRSDRMTTDLVQTGAKNDGPLQFELSFPTTRTYFDQFIGSAFFNTWTIMAERYNVTSDSVITQVTAASDTFTCTDTGENFAEGHLVRASGFTNSGNNQLFRAQSGSSGTACVAPSSPGLTDEAAPPAGARLKVVGFQGASGDITAGASSLGSTLLDFTTLGLSVGQWIKTGGTAAGDKFATAACNGWARITAIAANTLTLDNLPTGWTTDTGAGKTIMVFCGDILKNSTTMRSFTVEKGFLDQGTPTYATYLGCVVGGMDLTFQANQIVSGSFTLLGMTHATATSSLGSATAATTAGVMNAVSNVGRIAEGGSEVTTPNYVQSLTMQINNNLREKPAIGILGLSGIGAGEFSVSGAMRTYFGSKALYDKYVAGTETSINVRVTKDSQAVIFTLPRIKFDSGKIVAAGANQDVLADMTYVAIRDSTTSCHAQIDRVEEYQ